MRLLLVDTRVASYETFVNSAKSNVTAVTYSFYEDTFASILSRIPSQQYESVGVISHKYDTPYYQFVASAQQSIIHGVEQEDAQLQSWSEFAAFLAALQAPVIDMMACRLFADQEWKYVFDSLEKQLNIQIRASSDDTGNLAAGGNWIMESDNINVQDLYFTQQIEEYSYLLYDTVYWKSNRINTSNVKYENQQVITWGSSLYGGDSSTVSTQLQSGVTAIYSTQYAFAALKTGGKAVTWGNSTYGGNSSTVSADLQSDISAIYSTGQAFAALKQYGSVVTWGNSTYGGNSSTVSGELYQV